MRFRLSAGWRQEDGGYDEDSIKPLSPTQIIGIAIALIILFASVFAG